MTTIEAVESYLLTKALPGYHLARHHDGRTGDELFIVHAPTHEHMGAIHVTREFLEDTRPEQVADWFLGRDLAAALQPGGHVFIHTGHRN